MIQARGDILETDDPIQAQLIAARRKQILDAATRVFAAKGVARATVREIAREAGVADGTIYNYFENKDALLFGILDRLNQTPEREQHFEQGARMDVVAFFRLYLKERMALFEELGFDAFRVLFSELLVNETLREQYERQVMAPTFGIAERAFRRWIDAGAIVPLDPRVTTRVISAVTVGMLLLRLLDDDFLATHWDDIPNAVVELLTHGLIGATGGSDADATTDPAAESPGPGAGAAETGDTGV